jgi:hypothetical protein
MTLEQLRQKRNRPIRKIKESTQEIIKQQEALWEVMYQEFIERINIDPDYKQQCKDSGITVYGARDVRSILGT